MEAILFLAQLCQSYRSTTTFLFHFITSSFIISNRI